MVRQSNSHRTPEKNILEQENFFNICFSWTLRERWRLLGTKPNKPWRLIPTQPRATRTTHTVHRLCQNRVSGTELPDLVLVIYSIRFCWCDPRYPSGVLFQPWEENLGVAEDIPLLTQSSKLQQHRSLPGSRKTDIQFLMSVAD